MNSRAESSAVATVGLMADPGMPRKVATAISDRLQKDLESTFGGSWTVAVDQQVLPLDPDGEIRLSSFAPEILGRNQWDFLLYLTDLPILHQQAPLEYDVSDTAPAASISLPAVGVFRVRTKVRKLAFDLVRAAVGESGLDAPGQDHLPSPPRSKRTDSLRLLSGMILNNRPNRLVISLSGITVAAAGSGAFGIFFGSLLPLADQLHPVRLLLISLLSVVTLTAWLILRNGLWNLKRSDTEPVNRQLDNSATLITVTTGVAIMFVGLLLAMLALSLIVLDSGFVDSQLGRPSQFGDYFMLAWLSSCLGTFAGALGSNFDSEDSVREATYSLRWHERRKLFDNYSDRDGFQ